MSSVMEFIFSCFAVVAFLGFFKWKADRRIYWALVAFTAGSFLYTPEITTMRKIGVSFLVLWYSAYKLDVVKFLFVLDGVKAQFDNIGIEVREWVGTANDEELVTPPVRVITNDATPQTRGAIPPQQEPASAIAPQDEPLIFTPYIRPSTPATNFKAFEVRRHRSERSHPHSMPLATHAMSDYQLGDFSKRNTMFGIKSGPKPVGPTKVPRRTHQVKPKQTLHSRVMYHLEEPRLEGILRGHLSDFDKACFVDPTLNWRQPMESIRSMLRDAAWDIQNNGAQGKWCQQGQEWTGSLNDLYKLLAANTVKFALGNEPSISEFAREVVCFGREVGLGFQDIVFPTTHQAQAVLAAQAGVPQVQASTVQSSFAPQAEVPQPQLSAVEPSFVPVAQKIVSVQQAPRVPSVSQTVDLKAQQSAPAFSAPPPVALASPVTAPPPAVNAPSQSKPLGSPATSGSASRFANRRGTQRYPGNTIRSQGSSAQVPVSKPVIKPVLVFDDIKWDIVNLVTLAQECTTSRLDKTDDELNKVSILDELKWDNDVEIYMSDAQLAAADHDRTQLERRLKTIVPGLKKGSFLLRLQIQPLIKPDERGITTVVYDEMLECLRTVMDKLKIFTGDEWKKVPAGDWADFVEVMKFLQEKVIQEWDGKLSARFGMQATRELKTNVSRVLNRFP